MKIYLPSFAIDLEFMIPVFQMSDFEASLSIAQGQQKITKELL